MFRRRREAAVEVAEAARLHAAGAVLLDTREADEWAAGHAPGAEHVPLGAVPGQAVRFGGKQVLTVCRSGRRSALAAKTLREAGVDALNVTGGMSAWASHGLPVVRDDGSPGRIV